MNTEELKLLFGKDGFVLPKTSGRSMRPVIWGGRHRVVVVPLEGMPRVGDILMFTRPLSGGEEKNVIHRLVEIRHDGQGDLFVTRGDNCLGTEMVRRDDIIGRVAEIHRIGGYRPWHIIPRRQFSVEYPPYRVYSRLWMAIWPLRRLYYIVRALVKKIGN